MLQLLFLTLFVAHFCACGFLYITYIDTNQVEGWLISAEIKDDSWEVKYINSVYYIIITMSTIGYGDISPVTNFEKIIGIFISLVACGVFAFAVNMIGSAFQERDQRKGEYLKRKQSALKFMKVRQISKQSQLKVIKYMDYEYNLMDQEGNLEQGQRVINSISKNIRDEVYKEFYKPILKSSQVLSIYFSTQFLEKLSLKMKELNLSQGEIVEEEGGSNQNLYYVYKGQMEIYEELQQGKQKIIGYIEQGSFFGQNSFFFKNTLNLQNIRSKNFSQVLYIERNDFLDLLKDFPNQKEGFSLLKERMINDKNFSKCQLCRSQQHSIENCNLVHYQPYKDKIIQQFIRNDSKIISKRKRYYRDIDKKQQPFSKSLNYLSNYRQKAILLRKDLVLGDINYKDFQNVFQDVLNMNDKYCCFCIPYFKYTTDCNFYEIQQIDNFLEQK